MNKFRRINETKRLSNPRKELSRDAFGRRSLSPFSSQRLQNSFCGFPLKGAFRSEANKFTDPRGGARFQRCFASLGAPSNSNPRFARARPSKFPFRKRSADGEFSALEQNCLFYLLKANHLFLSSAPELLRRSRKALSAFLGRCFEELEACEIAVELRRFVLNGHQNCPGN